MAISFDQIPNTLRLPFTYTEFDPSQAFQGLSVNPFTVLLAGQKLASGNAEAGKIYRPTSAAQARQWFGPGSQLAQMVEAYLNANNVTQMIAVASDDLPAGVPAEGAFSLDGTVTTAAPLMLYIGGRGLAVATTNGQSAASVVTAAIAAINADANMPVIASGAGTAIELSAKHAGDCGNDIDLRIAHYGETIPAGLTLGIVSMAGGAGNPDAIANIAGWPTSQCQVIAWPWQDGASLLALKNEMDSRWGPVRQNDGQAITVKTGSYGQVLDFMDNNNNRGLSVFASEGSPTLPWADAAASAGVLAYYANTDPARGFNTLVVPGVIAPHESWPDFPEKNQSLFNGISSRYVNPDGKVCFSKVITTYRQNSLGAEDQAYLSINTCFTLSYLRYDWNNYIKTKYPRHKLASDADAQRFGPGQAIMTPSLARAEAITRFGLWLNNGLVQGSAQFKNDIIAELNTSNPNRLDILMRPNLVNQFEILGSKMQFLLQAPTA